MGLGHVLQGANRSEEEPCLGQSNESVSTALRAAVLDTQERLDKACAVKNGKSLQQGWLERVHGAVTVGELLEVMDEQRDEAVQRIETLQKSQVCAWRSNSTQPK